MAPAMMMRMSLNHRWLVGKLECGLVKCVCESAELSKVSAGEYHECKVKPTTQEFVG